MTTIRAIDLSIRCFLLAGALCFFTAALRLAAPALRPAWRLLGAVLGRLWRGLAGLARWLFTRLFHRPARVDLGLSFEPIQKLKR